MRKRSVVSVLVLSLALVGCGGDDDDGDGGGDGADAAPAQIDAAAPTIDAAVAGPAANLGVPCTAAVACPNGEECSVLTGVGSTTEGFCTITCAGQKDDATCRDGYTGPGIAGCVLMGGGENQCAIECTGGAGSCPEGLSCFETAGPMLCLGDEGV